MTKEKEQNEYAIEVKKCSKCGEIKSVYSFYKDIKSKDGLREACKECYRNKQKEYRKNNREKCRAYRKKHYKDNIKYYIDYGLEENNRNNYDGNRDKVLKRDNYKCTNCGSDKILDVHHIDGNGYGKESKNNEMSNLITLCHSCHTRIHWDERKILQIDKQGEI